MFVLCIVRLMFGYCSELLGYCAVCVFVLRCVYWIALLLIVVLYVVVGCWLLAGWCCCLIFICWWVC